MENGHLSKLIDFKEHFDNRHDDIEASLKQLMVSTERLSSAVNNLSVNVNQFALITSNAMTTIKEISKQKNEHATFKEVTVLIIGVIIVVMLFIGVFHGDIKGADVINKIPNFQIGAQ